MKWKKFIPGWFTTESGGILFPKTKRDEEQQKRGREPDGCWDNHNSGSICLEDDKCIICQNEKRCLYLCNHRFGDTDELDVSICEDCLKTGLKYFEGKKP